MSMPILVTMLVSQASAERQSENAAIKRFLLKVARVRHQCRDRSARSKQGWGAGEPMAAGRVTGRLIKLFITGDEPRSLRMVELDNWWSMAVMGRRPYFKKSLAREELSCSCIYLLILSTGTDDLPEVYVGESDDFVQRYAASPFSIPFDSFVVFTNKDDNLTRGR